MPKNFTLQWCMSSGGKWLMKYFKRIPGFIQINKKIGNFPNIHQVFYMSTLMKHYPEMKFVHLVRDGIDSVFGRIHANHGDDIFVPLDYDFNSKTWNALEKYERYAYVWKWMMEEAIKCRDNERYYEVRYEDILLKPKETIDKMFGFLEIDNDEIKKEIINSIKLDGLNRHKHYEKEKINKVMNIIKDIRKEVGYNELEK